MAAPTLKVRKESPPERGEPTAEELIRLLVSRASTLGPGHSNAPLGTDSSYSEEILVDLDLDGVRYLLVRLPKADQARVRLSPREQEIVRMVAQGHPNKVIADVLSISAWTVCTHVRRIFAKLGVGSRAAMVARLLENGGGREHMTRYPHQTKQVNTEAGISSTTVSQCSRKLAFDLKSELTAQRVR
jgi:DNA-binding CsgD family transcriptional regulator